MIAATVASLWLTASRLHISSDLSALFPDRAASVALGRFVRAFGGGDVAAVLLRGDPGELAVATHELAALLGQLPSVTRVVERAPTGMADSERLDPTLAWRYAGPRAQAALEEALTPEGMRARLETTRELLLAPGSSEAETWLAKDPLRLALVPWERRDELAAGVTPGADGAFVTDDGRARLVVVSPRGNAFDATASEAFVVAAEGAFARVRTLHPKISIALTGGHAIAYATREMLIRDLALSGTLSLLFACLTFVVTFRRVRALVAVVPPLILGTLWTTGLAAFAPGGLSAIAIAFTAVVVGVGVDTGVHVYSALLDGRRQGLEPHDAARAARARTARPTLLAAIAAAVAFASLALSDLTALRQLGILCAAGEVLTALAIVLVTPEIGAQLERGAPPPAMVPGWLGRVVALTRTRTRAWTALVIALLPAIVLVVIGGPKGADAIVAVRPRALEPLATQAEIYRLFGGRPGQWIVLSIDAQSDRASARADAVSDALEPLAADHTILGFDSLAPYAPARATARARLARRDTLDLPNRRADLAKALTEKGFDLDACAPALAAFDHPSALGVGGASPDAERTPIDWLVARHVAQDGGETLAATFVRPLRETGADARALAAIRSADPGAIVTGYPYLEKELEDSLAHDLPRVGLVAFLLVAIALRAVLGRARDVTLAFVTIAAEIGAVALAMRVLHLRWHVYDALVLPVLIGVTIDESMFLLSAARDRVGEADPVTGALKAQGPLVTSTAVTTAAGFAALLACRFDGLADLGAVGTLGVLIGLVAALVVVPAGLRLQTRGGSSRSDSP